MPVVPFQGRMHKNTLNISNNHGVTFNTGVTLNTDFNLFRLFYQMFLKDITFVQ